MARATSTAAAAAAAAAAAFVFTLCTNHAAAVFRLVGPYELDVRNLDKCEDQGENKLNFTARLQKNSPTQYVYTGPWTWPYPLDKQWRVHLSADRWGTGGWGKNALSYDSTSPCEDALRLCKNMFKSFAEAGGFPTECPVPAGTYMFKNWKVNIELPFSQLPYGRYRIDIVFLYQQRRMGCIRLHTDVNQKTPSHG